MRSGFFLPGWTNPNVARLLAKLVERGGSQIAHPALHATDQIGENIVYVTADFLQGFNAFRGDFFGTVILVVTVACGTPGLHGGERSHTPIGLINLAAYFHDFARCFPATSQQPAEDNGITNGEGFNYIALLGDTTVSD